MFARGHIGASSPALHARLAVWTLFVCVLLLAALAPVVVLLRAASSPIAAHACIAPASPRLGQQAYLVVVIAKQSDQAALHGPWAQVSARWDMTTMEMGAHTVSVSGNQITAATVDVPLTLDMSGAWKANIAVHTPGRPVWRQTLAFTVSGSGGALDVTAPDVRLDGGNTPCLM